MTLIPLSFPFHFPFHWSNSSSHPCTPGLLSQPLSGLPQAPVTPSQAIPQTSREQKPLCSPLGWRGALSLLTGVNEKPLPALLGPPESASSRFLVFSLDLPTWVLWFNMKSTYQKNLQPYPSPHQNALHELPWHGPEPQRSPGLCSHLLGEALSPSTGICPSLELLVSDYFGGSSRVLCLTDCPSTPAFAQLIHELLEGELAA